MSPIELLPPAEARPDNPRWHELRREGITASEIAAVMGLSPWSSPFNLYWSKVNGWGGEQNEFTSTGSHLEDAIADWWMAECDPLENLVAERAGLYAHPDRPWQLATPDRLLHEPCACCSDGMCSCGLYGACSDCYNTGLGGPAHALLECKWVGQPTWDGWGEPGTDEIPVYYRAQALWQADTLGVGEVHFAVLGPGGFRSYVLRIDDAAREDLRVMRSQAVTFMGQLTASVPPDLDGHSATINALRKLHPTVGEGDVEVPVELAERYRQARADRKAAEAVIDECEAQIRAALGSDFNRAVAGPKQRLVASRSVYEQSGDSAELTALEGDWPVVDRLNPGRATSYA